MLSIGGLKSIAAGGGSASFSGPLTASTLTLTSSAQGILSFAGGGNKTIAWAPAGAADMTYAVGTNRLTCGMSITCTGDVTANAGLVGNAASNSSHLILRNTTHSTLWTQIVTGAANDLGFWNNSTALCLQIQNDGTVKVGAGTVSGASTTMSRVGGALNVDSTGVGNVGASGPDTLQTYSLPANALTLASRGLKIKAYGTTANNANAKTVRLIFGGTTLITKQLTASIAGVWEIEAVILRTGSSAQDYYAKALNNGGTTVSSTDGATVYSIQAFGTATETETGAITISTQSTASTADNDIVSQGLIVEYL